MEPQDSAGMGRCFELEIVTLESKLETNTPEKIKKMLEALGSVGIALTNQSDGYTIFAVLPISELL